MSSPSADQHGVDEAHDGLRADERPDRDPDPAQHLGEVPARARTRDAAHPRQELRAVLDEQEREDERQHDRDHAGRDRADAREHARRDGRHALLHARRHLLDERGELAVGEVERRAREPRLGSLWTPATTLARSAARLPATADPTRLISTPTRRSRPSTTTADGERGREAVAAQPRGGRPEHRGQHDGEQRGEHDGPQRADEEAQQPDPGRDEQQARTPAGGPRQADTDNTATSGAGHDARLKGRAGDQSSGRADEDLFGAGEPVRRRHDVGLLAGGGQHDPPARGRRRGGVPRPSSISVVPPPRSRTTFASRKRSSSTGAMPCCVANCLQDSSWARKNATGSGAAVVGAAVGAVVGAGAGVPAVVHPASATSATPTVHAIPRTQPVWHRKSSSRLRTPAASRPRPRVGRVLAGPAALAELQRAGTCRP